MAELFRHHRNYVRHPEIRSVSRKIPPHLPAMSSAQNYSHLLENKIDLMVGFTQEHHEELASIRLGTLHLLPFVSRSYVEKHGLPTRDNLAEHTFYRFQAIFGENGVMGTLESCRRTRAHVLHQRCFRYLRSDG